MMSSCHWRSTTFCSMAGLFRVINQDDFVCPEMAVPSASVCICPLPFSLLLMDERVHADWLFSFNTQAVNSLVMSR